MNANIAVKGWRADGKGTGGFLSSSKALMAPFIGPAERVFLPMCEKHAGSMSALADLALVEDQKPRRL
jgi:hypothetical protein